MFDRPGAFVCFLIVIVFAATSCKRPKTSANEVFEVLEHTQTGLSFSNKLKATPQFNMFRYMYFYNGAGVGAGDFNRDGLIDLFFAANQSENTLYLNKGGLKFTDVTKAAGIPQDGGWSTGVSVVDINNDGLLDIYIARVGNFEILKSKNQLLVCQGVDGNNIPTFVDKAEEYGLAFSGFTTQATFFDYDMDGDLDCFLLNHSVHQNGSFSERKSFLGTYHPLSGDRLYRNDGQKFTDVTKESGINSSAISYGLGIAVSDINLDGYPDMYMGNDFHENDYLYINQRNGTFSEVLTDRVGHTSKFSMGVDVADVNNDAYPEIISVDMLPSDPLILKSSLGDDDYHTFQLKLRYGYNHQYSRNNLQWNRRAERFSEVGLYAGIAATDWSWAPLWMDFDNDGWKDLFISNGIPKRLNDVDYVNYVTNSEMQQKINNNQVDEVDMELIDKFPQIKLSNKIFKNEGELRFSNVENSITNDLPAYSNGAVYADLDNDGDLDIVVNNIDDPVLLYQNKSNDKGLKKWVSIKLTGPEKNINAVGAKVIVYAESSVRTYEKSPVRGFQSSMEIPLHIGLDKTIVDSAFLVWPDNSFQSISLTGAHTQMDIRYQVGLPAYDYANLKAHQQNEAREMTDITAAVGLGYRHEENNFIEFDREPLIPFMVSREGPALAVGDLDGDKLDDVYIGAAKGKKAAIFLQTKRGQFVPSSQPHLDRDSTYEDVDAKWSDLNGDGRLDLVVASGGNEYYGTDNFLLPRIYLNDGEGGLVKKEDAFSNIYVTASCVETIDFNKDGRMDLFVGGRAVPWEYGKIPESYLLLNDGSACFKNVTSTYAKGLSSAGFVKSADAVDLDRDGDLDLLLALEWGAITVFINDRGMFTGKQLTQDLGWWNCAVPVDVDGDGDLDVIAGNQGMNNRLSPTKKTPVRLYYNDFDGNGKKEQLLTYYLNGEELLFATKEEIQKQIPTIKKDFLLAKDFAKASLEDLFTKEKVKGAEVRTADYFANAIFINDGQMNFTVRALPWSAQLSPVKDVVIVAANADTLPDLLVVGNFYESTIQMGRSDADYGTVLLNSGKGVFKTGPINGLSIGGQVKQVKAITIKGRNAYVLARNNDSTLVIGNKGSGN